MIGIRILHGMSRAVSTTAVYTTITDIIPFARRGEGMGWFSTAATLAMAVGPMFAIWVTQNLSYDALLLFAVGFSAAALLLMFGAKMPFRPQSGARTIELFENRSCPSRYRSFLCKSLMAALPLLSRCSLTRSRSIPACSFLPMPQPLR